MNLNLHCLPLVRVKAWSADGQLLWTRFKHNTLTYAGADVLARAITGGDAARITHLYARFGTSSAQDPGWLPIVDVKATTRNTFMQPVEGSNAVGGLWVPLLSPPVITSTGAPYQGNRVTYFFRIPASISSSQVEPPGTFDQVTSLFVSLGLAVARDTADRHQDIILSVLQASGNGSDDFTAFMIPVGGQMTVDYPLPFSA